MIFLSGVDRQRTIEECLNAMGGRKRPRNRRAIGEIIHQRRTSDIVRITDGDFFPGAGIGWQLLRAAFDVVDNDKGCPR